MDINIQTIAFVVGITHIIQFLVFYHQYKVNKTYKGIGWWLLWSITEALGFFVIILRGYIPSTPFIIIVQNSLIISGTLFIYVGIMMFLGKKVNWKAVISIFVVFLLTLCYFIFIHNNILIRSGIIDVALVVISLFTAYNLYRNKFRSISSSANFIVITFIIHGIIFGYLAVINLFIGKEFELFTPVYINIIQFTDAFIVGLLWTFGFIIMLNQQLNAENTEDKDQLELIFNTSPDAMLITHLKDGYFVKINDGFTALTGYTREDLNGKSTLDLNIWSDKEDRKKIIRELNGNGIVHNHEVDFRLKDGSKLTGMVSANLIHFNGVPCILSVTRDINERKRAEMVLHESEDRLARAEKIAKIGNWKICLDTKEVISSAGARINYGVENGKLTLEDVQRVPLPEYRSMLDNALTDLISINKPYNVEFKIKRLNDDKILDIHSIAEFDKINNAVYGVVHDITDRKTADEEIQKQNEQLVIINAEKDKFFSIIAHDLRSPFNGFLGLTKLMVTDLHSMTLEDINKIAGSLHNSANNLFRLLTNLLDWSMMQRGLITFNSERLSLENIVSENIRIFHDTAKDKGIEIVDTIPEDIFLMADKRMLETIIRNLISNAIKFTKKGGSVTIAANSSDNFINVSIKDSGIGMDEKLISDLFKIDRQISRKGTENEPSTGLGLLLCKEFAKKNGGDISVKSEVGNGSEFTLIFKRDFNNNL